MKKLLLALMAIGIAVSGVTEAATKKKRTSGTSRSKAERTSGTSRKRSGGTSRTASDEEAGQEGGTKSTASRGAKRSGGTKRSKSSRSGGTKRSKSSRSGGTKRSKSSRSGGVSRKRSGGVNRRRAAMGARGDAADTKSNMVVEEISENPCPLGKPVQKIYDENGDTQYFVSKAKQCNPPTNSSEKGYTRDMNIDLPSFIQPEEAIVFNCIGGYTAGKVDKVEACINTATFCPIGEVVARVARVALPKEETPQPVAKKARRGRGRKAAAPVKQEEKKAKPAAPVVSLKNARTDTICIPPPGTVLRNMENSPQAVTLECPANMYSDVIEGAGGNHIRCVKCPEGKISFKGSFASSDCHLLCPEGQMNNPVNMDECLPCAENSHYDAELKTCVCDPGFHGTGGGAGACQPCPDGSYCPGGRAIEVCDAAERQYSAPGSTGCKTCPPDAVSSEGKTCSCLRQGKKFNAETNLCE